MATTKLRALYCSTHRLLYLSWLQEWLGHTPKQIENIYGERLSVRERACPKCDVTVQKKFREQFPELYMPSAA